MTDKYALEPLLKLAQLRSDEAARQLGGLLANERACQDKLALIEGYRTEYRQQFQALATRGLETYAWDNYARFMQRIDAAIGAQQAALTSCQRQSAEGQRAWLARQQQWQAYDLLAQRHRAAVGQQAGRRAQKLTDEHAARRYAALAATAG